MERHETARGALRAWRADVGQNFFDGDGFFQGVLRHHLGAPAFEAERGGLSAFGAECAGPIDRLARETNRDEYLPRLRRWDPLGHRIEAVIFDPAYHELGERVYRTGLVARYRQPGQELAQLAYAYLLCQNGEAGHMCPVACTAGMIKILQRLGSQALQDRVLPGLLRDDRGHPEHYHAAQWLTELQGGSDVGENACVARQDPDGDWRLYGEKWFCSVADADLFLITARPEGAGAGTRGLATFIVPRHLEGGVINGFSLRRLKIKLGTRSMASGEVDLEGAVGWPVGPLAGGFGKVVEIVLGTSRLHNAVAATGAMRRAQIVAEAYAAHRTAFGRAIEGYPLVRRSLDRIGAETRAGTATSFDLIATADQIARGEGDAAAEAVFRMGVCMNKYWTAIRGTWVIREAIEVLGGNGTIEDFSVLPRLYRDAIVTESWEGSHNVLCLQVLKDMKRLGVHEAFLSHLQAKLGPAGDEALSARLATDRRRAAALLDAPSERAQVEIRDLIDHLMVTWQLAELSALDRAHPGRFPQAPHDLSTLQALHGS